ncbi:uncharacterized protein LOC106154747 isoform X1 [Lingula anatina]|uniref:Uncharacterized protein LOC106154747 isoform X1 n=1 Tax=Lingula anatina TaxID=7574 RepID=A0A1S3HGQ7_LINAN|nr:uncharacterized protein LOC106154747 isoform X1 [Lingula anatina]|eukprot:XP_013384661.1 uncharacterized protein LOC106154747 isoform X1 [Lingula anatina]
MVTISYAFVLIILEETLATQGKGQEGKSTKGRRRRKSSREESLGFTTNDQWTRDERYLKAYIFPGAVKCKRRRQWACFEYQDDLDLSLCSAYPYYEINSALPDIKNNVFAFHSIALSTDGYLIHILK